MKRLTADEFIGQFDERVHNEIRRAIFWQYPDAIAFVCFQNLDIGSTHSNQCTCLPIGPSCTYKAVEDTEGKHLNDLPSQRQYPVSWCPIDELRATNPAVDEFWASYDLPSLNTHQLARALLALPEQVIKPASTYAPQTVDKMVTIPGTAKHYNLDIRLLAYLV